MFPVLFEIPVFGGLRIYTYGVLVALGFLLGIGWTTREARRVGIDKEVILDLSFYIILSALIGSRVLYILTEWRHYLQHPLAVFKVWEGGLIFYGGLIGAIITSYSYLKRHRLSFLAIADLFAPGISLGHAIGRLGCFAAGCCHGRETTGIFSIIFPNRPFSLAPAGVPLYPTQLMESASSLLIFLILVFFRGKKRFDGQVFFIYLTLYSLLRSLLEFFRGESARTILIPPWFSVSQFISLLLIGITLLYHWRGRRVKL